MRTCGLRAATVEEVHSLSYGLVKFAGAPNMDWQDARNSLYDKVAFGSDRDWTCACGYTVFPASDRFCVVCGALVGVASVLRAHRFGHLYLHAAVDHPLFPDATLRTLPVMPIGVRELYPSLNWLYEQLLNALNATAITEDRRTGMVVEAVNRLFGTEPVPRSEWPGDEFPEALITLAEMAVLDKNCALVGACLFGMAARLTF